MPRAQPTRQDATALAFLDAAAELIDASMGSPVESPMRRLRQFRFPAALDWIRVEDVLAVAARQQHRGRSKKAFLNRWATRDEFLTDAVVYAMLYRDQPDDIRPDPVHLDELPGSERFSLGISALIDHIMATMTAHPRTFLLCHVAPYVGLHPGLAEAVGVAADQERARWVVGYTAVLGRLGLQPRPDWTVERLGMALQCILDGFVLRYKVQPEVLAGYRWQSASLLADTVTAFLGGVLDFDGSGRSSREFVDRMAVGAPRSGR